ncbi:hypothetical protein HA402_006520 [Bradysia odoriphaga]|nr:hypothetical protein HA402_006520 [Bradysia odoriphaga]
MKMDFAKKLIIYCVVTSSVIYSVQSDSQQDRDACLVQYLQRKGKLSADIKSAEPAPSSCDFVTPFTIGVIKSAVFNTIEKEIPLNVARCLIQQLDDNDNEAFDYVVKINVLAASRSLNESERQTQVEATRNLFKEDLEKIAVHCETDAQKFISIFKDSLGIRNDSLAVLQYEYCLAKYAVDAGVVVLGDVEINPQHIDLSSVECEQIIEADRSRSEKYFIDKNALTFEGEESMNCAVNAYRNNKIYDWTVAFKVLKNLSFSLEQKEEESNKIKAKMQKFASSTSVCSAQDSQQ